LIDSLQRHYDTIVDLRRSGPEGAWKAKLEPITALARYVGGRTFTDMLVFRKA
jgi:hypothetical protein